MTCSKITRNWRLLRATSAPSSITWPRRSSTYPCLYADPFREVAEFQRWPRLVFVAESADGQVESVWVSVGRCREPNPLFSHHKVPINNPHMNASSINFNNTVTPPRAALDEKGKYPITQTINTNEPWMRVSPWYDPLSSRSPSIMRFPPLPVRSHNSSTPTVSHWILWRNRPIAVRSMRRSAWRMRSHPNWPRIWLSPYWDYPTTFLPCWCRDARVRPRLPRWPDKNSTRFGRSCRMRHRIGELFGCWVRRERRSMRLSTTSRCFSNRSLSCILV